MKVNENLTNKHQGETLAFDVYGTLIDTAGVYAALEKLVGTHATLFMNTWRAKQLEYSFRRGLMQNYVDFTTCTRQSLEYTCNLFNMNFSDDKKNNLMQEYDILPCFPDVKEGLNKLKQSKCRMFAFSNGIANNVQKLLQNAGLDHYFDGVVSVDDLKSYKPNPAVYAYFLRKTESIISQSWLISSNPFDVIGAVSAGIRSVWIRRTPNAIFDPWEIEPTAIAESIIDVNTIINSLPFH
jgi:2-haloacid dehalogenase